jgi:glycosyltransferase involved in cell wall biosynthesis
VPSGKLFEYLAAGRPILALVPPDGAASDLVRAADAGIVVAPDDVGAIKSAIEELVQRWRSGTLEGPSLSDELRARSDRRARSAEFAAFLREFD